MDYGFLREFRTQVQVQVQVYGDWQFLRHLLLLLAKYTHNRCADMKIESPVTDNRTGLP